MPGKSLPPPILTMKRDTYPKIFVLRSGAIGDSILSTPALAALRKGFPASHITLIGDPFSAPIFENSPDIDRLIAIDRKAMPMPVYVFRLLQLRLERPSLLIDMQGGARSAVQTALIGGARRIGWQSRQTRSFTYTDHATDRKNVHFVLRQAELLKPLGIPPTEGEGPLRLVLSASERAQGRHLLEETGCPPQKPYVILQATAGEHKRSLKQWQPERFAALADRLQRELGLAVALTGHGIDERPVIDQILAHAELPILDLFGKTSLRMFAALAAGSAMYIGCDTGPMHLAAAVGAPIVALFGPTDPVRWHPWTQSPYRVVRMALPCSPCDGITCAHDQECMMTLSVDTVFRAVEEVGLLDPVTNYCASIA